MTTSPHTLAVFVSGLGGNQFKEKDLEGLSLIDRAEKLDGVHVVVLPRDGDVGAAILSALDEFPTIMRVVVICHSGGWYVSAKAAEKGLVDFLVAVDPAWWDLRQHKWPHPDGKRQPGAFFKATGGRCGTIPLKISDGQPIRELPFDHNKITRAPEVRGSVLTLLNLDPDAVHPQE